LALFLAIAHSFIPVLFAQSPAKLLGAWKGLQFYTFGKDTIDFPFDGQNPIIKVMIINTGTTNSPAGIDLKVRSSAVQGSELTKFPNGGNIAVLRPGDTTYASCWVTELYQRPVTPFRHGEFRTISMEFVFEFGNIMNRESYTVKRDVVVYFGGQNPSPVGTSRIQGRIVFPSKPLPNAQLTVSTMNWRGGNLTLTPNDSGYTFSGVIGDRGDWYLGLMAAGYKSQTVKINRSAAQDIRITPEVSTERPSLQFDLIASVPTSTGFWRGAVSESEKTVCVFPGQENWNLSHDSMLKATAKIYKYSLEGQKIWEFSPGWETWGGDMSRDGKYVVYALYTGAPPGPGAAYKGGFTIGLIDGLTGRELWKKIGAKVYESYEIIFSDDAQFIAVGSTASGQVALLQRETGNTLWTAPIVGEIDPNFGQIRRMKFDRNGEFLYIGSGDGYLRKIRVVDGNVVWRTFVGSWPFVNGLNISVDGSLIAVGMKSAQVAMVRSSDGKLLWTHDTGNFDELFLSSDGKYAASYSGKHFNAWTGELLGHSGSYSIGAFTSDSKYICRYPAEVELYSITGTAERLYRSQSGAQIARQAGEQAQWGYLTSDDRYVVVAARDMLNPPQIGLVFYRSKQLATSVQEQKQKPSMAVSPNPASDVVTIEFTLPTSAHVSLNVFNALGQTITHIVKATLSAGQHTYTLNTHTFAQGSQTLFVHFNTNNQHFTTIPIQVLR
jgi:hypothetical protein